MAAVVVEPVGDWSTARAASHDLAWIFQQFNHYTGNGGGGR